MKRRHLQSLSLAFTFFLVLGLALVTCQSKPPKLTPAVPGTSTVAPLPSQEATKLAEHATPTPIPSATPWPVASPTPYVEPTDVNLGSINPLTGLKVEDPLLLRQRPVLVKIANWSEAFRPAEGLNQADMVFEYFIGAQTKHILALYYGNDYEHVGPLDDGKVIDARLTEHFQGHLVIGSADGILENVLTNFLKDRHARRGYVGCPGICTETVAQGGLTFVDTAAVRETLAKNVSRAYSPKLFGFIFDETPAPSNDKALRYSYLYADFSVMDWRYDEEKGAYALWQDKYVSPGKYTLAQSEDRATGEPITFENVVFLFTNYQDYRKLFFDINFNPGNLKQPGILLRNGNQYPIHWGAASYDTPILIYDLQGEPMPLKPGKTWFTLTSLDSKLEKVSEGEWDMTFYVK